ncbi:MAG: hypothetical protein H0X39_02190 [Actinobacteria bacterium]|nr:hypothetical protein [Actinomycetota bacterium]
MPRYLVETYLARGEAGGRLAAERRARSAVLESRRAGGRVRFDHSIHIPVDETCFYIFEAQSAADVIDVAKRASLGAVRVVEAVTSQKERA